MPDKWSQYAVPSQGGQSAPAAKDKWAQYAQPAQPQQPMQEAQKPATIGAPTPITLGGFLKHPLNTLESLAQPTTRPSGASIPEMAATDAANVGSGGLSVLRHPIDTIKGAIGFGLRANPVGVAADIKAGHPTVYQDVYNQANENGPQFGAYSLGQAAAIPAIAEGAVKAGKPIGVGLEKVGSRMQDTGGDIMNHTVGSLQRDFRRNADPGRAYLDAGGGPALSMGSLAKKGAALKDATGAKIGAAYDNATKNGVLIPPKVVGDAIGGPINAARAVITGPGGTGNVDAIDQFGQGFRPALQNAVQNGGFTPNDLFGIKRNVSESTNWSDPTQLGLKKVQQQTAGAISGVLSDYVPEVKELNPQYQGLKNFSTRANLRAQTGSMPLTRIMGRLGTGAVGAGLGMMHDPAAATALAGVGLALDSVPVKTATASGLYGAGKGAVAIGKGLQGLYSRAQAVPTQPSTALVPPKKAALTRKP